MGDMLRSSLVHWSAAEFLNSREYESEFAELSRRLADRYQGVDLPLEVESKISSQTGMALYGWIRHNRPRVVLETGISNGYSTVILLNAIMQNGYGEVHSIDVRGDVGGLLSDAERKISHFHILPAVGTKQAFSQLVARLAPLDLFFHDSQHFYGWQMFEYQTAWSHLNSTGLLGSDDADGNCAFLDFAKLIGHKPHLVADDRKVAGFIMPSSGV
jgi:predicted O-methyltransferase YrrM